MGNDSGEKKHPTSSKKKSAVAKKVLQGSVKRPIGTKGPPKMDAVASHTIKANKGIETAAGPPAPIMEPGIDSDRGSSSDGSRRSYQKLVNPQNYHEYMRASKFRGGR